MSKGCDLEDEILHVRPGVYRMLELVLLDSTYICKKWICCGILEIFLTYQRRIWSFVVFSKL